MRRSYFLVRHGRAVYQERAFAREEHAPGADHPLSPRGRAQAAQIAAPLLRLGVSRVISSRLARARETGELISDAGRLPFEHQWAGLDELHPATLRAAAPAAPPERWSFWESMRAAMAVRRYVRGGAEPRGWELRSVEDRILGVLRRLDALDEPRLAVVGHGYWILLASLFVGGRLRVRWIDNCSVTRVDADGRGRYRLVSFASALWGPSP